tara:strand:+ start:5056 stop:7869 length:2814 start_codon:yes stop_codon:yes gene_type:complete
MWKSKLVISALILFLPGCTFIPKVKVVEKVQPLSLSDLSLEEKVAQMFMVRYSGHYSHEESYTYQQIKRMVSERRIGGVILFFGSVQGTISNLNELQEMSRVPLLVAADYERGVGQQLDGGTLFPPNMALAATGYKQYAYDQGEITAKEGRAIGVHVTLAPVMDVNSNPENPIINIRSYSDDPQMVSDFGTAFIHGVQDNGMIACAKHFPGHGNTGTDSHTTLPIIHDDESTFREIDLFPFKRAVESGVKMIMTGHIAVPSLDATRLPASLSPKLTNDLLRNELGFHGIVISDAMEMGGVTESFWTGEATVRAIEAGTDIVLMSMDVDQAINKVVEAVKSGRLSENRIDKSVDKILNLKTELNLWNERTVFLETARKIMGQTKHSYTTDKIAKQSITLVKNDNGYIPIPVEKSKSMLHLALATDEGMLGFSSTFRSQVSRLHGNVDTEFYYQPLSDAGIEEILLKAVEHDFILISLWIRVRMNLGTVSIDSTHRELISHFQSTEIPMVTVSFGSPYLQDVDQLETYACAYGYGAVSQRAMTSALFGESYVTGGLPVSLSQNIRKETGIKFYPEKPLSPADEKYNFSKAEEVLQQALSDSIFPGAQVVVAKEGELIWAHQIGTLTYDYDSPSVTENTLYDIASLTKVAATTPVVMKLVERRLLPLDEPVFHFFPKFKREMKDQITVRQLLTHSAGLKPFEEYPLGTSPDDILNDIISKPLISIPGEEYHYSDFGPILLAKICEKVTGESFDELASKTIFRPLGMENTFFNPDSNLFDRIPPTELDTVYGRGLVRGMVHDERAWQLGGVAGHAGLFSAAGDLALYAQLMMDEGFFQGRRYFKRKTIAEFIRRQNIPADSERRLGWDTPSEEGSSAGDYFSEGSFGHTGFTGTSMWIDPNRKIAVILLTNRVHPSRNRGGMFEVRRDFHNAVMRTLLEGS